MVLVNELEGLSNKEMQEKLAKTTMPNAIRSFFVDLYESDPKDVITEITAWLPTDDLKEFMQRYLELRADE